MILVDTDVLIAHLRGEPAAHEWMVKARSDHGVLATSAISVAEVTGGMRSSERPEVWQLLARLRVQPVTDMVARRAGEFRRLHRRSHASIGLADYLIAATADCGALTLATLNVRHFPMFPDIQPPF